MLSNTILPFGTETIISASVRYLSIKGVFTWHYYFARFYAFFFLGGGDVKELIERG